MLLSHVDLDTLKGPAALIEWRLASDPVLPQEVAIMKTLDHPNIIKLFDAWIGTSDPE